MSAGILLVVAGIWVVSQVLGGNALGRLGITGAASVPGTTKNAGGGVGTAAGEAAKIAGGLLNANQK